MARTQEFTMEEVSFHCSADDCWVVVDGCVLDATEFLQLHPGGKNILLKFAGKDATAAFKYYHSDRVWAKHRARLQIGVVVDHQPRERFAPPGTFGDLVPYGDPAWYQRFNTPYYKETHRRFRDELRTFLEADIFPGIPSWRDKKRPPADVLQALGRRGYLAMMCGPPFPAEYLPASIPGPEAFDYFHELILYDELARCGDAAAVSALTNGWAIGIPALLRFGSAAMKQRVAPDCLLGKTMIALAISEPGAGSDVAGLACTATRDGDHYIVTGNKKWITNGMYADFFVTAVITDSSKPNRGQEGMSFLLIARDVPGLTIKRVPVRGGGVSGTAYLDFDRCRVPVSNLIGEENEGFKLVMWNFNHERMYIVTLCLRMARVCLEESIKYALVRKTFGKTLSEHQSIRMKVASMARQLESAWAWLDAIVYQLCTMSHEEANLKLGDVICLLKAHASKVYEHCAREATHVFGGNAVREGGMGYKIEAAVGQVKGYSIPAGAEDVMDDYGARAAFRAAKRFAKL